MKNKKKKKIKIKKPPVLFNETQKVIKKIGKTLDGDILAYWISNNGSLTQGDITPFYNIIKNNAKSKTLYLFVKSNGGSGKSALRIIHLLRNYYEKIVALVPLDCASAATMLVLGANKIQMGPLAYLSAIDTSITHELSPIDKKYNNKVSVSQNELDRVLKLWDKQKTESEPSPYSALYQYIHPLVFGSVDRASSLSIKLTKEILSYHLKDEKKADKISNHLNAEYPSHGYPITIKEAKKIGLNVEGLPGNINELLLELNYLYSKMAQRSHTDYNETKYHDNEILKVIELMGHQYFYQKEKDWFYRKEERRYIPMNDDSSWRRAKLVNGKVEVSKFYSR
ncbi:MAG TPA: hypothetical protein ENJ95_12080 [Bacteroidetes bacterium]|nr:hypothetical protein [Bacteroidota bacterium]